MTQVLWLGTSSSFLGPYGSLRVTTHAQLSAPICGSNCPCTYDLPPLLSRAKNRPTFFLWLLSHCNYLLLPLIFTYIFILKSFLKYFAVSLLSLVSNDMLMSLRVSDTDTANCAMTEVFVLPGVFVSVTGVYRFYSGHLLCKVDIRIPSCLPFVPPLFCIADHLSEDTCVYSHTWRPSSTHWDLIHSCSVWGLMFDPAADASLMCFTGVCLATVKSGEVSTGRTYSVSTLPHPAEGEAVVTYKILNKTLIKRAKEQKPVYKMQYKILLAGQATHLHFQDRKCFWILQARHPCPAFSYLPINSYYLVLHNDE